jgi:hypothetical protein
MLANIIAAKVKNIKNFFMLLKI